MSTIGLPVSSLQKATTYGIPSIISISGGVSVANGSDLITSSYPSIPPVIDEAYNQANVATSIATSSYSQANSATELANSATDLVYQVWAYANTIGGGASIDNVARVIATSASSNTIILQGVSNTQNVRLSSIETVNTNQNTSITIIQGINTTQNTAITNIQNIDATQNVRLSSIETVNTNQNTSITQINQFAQGAYNQANTGTTLAQAAFNSANSISGSISGASVNYATTAGSADYATYLNSSNYIQRIVSSGNLNTDFQNTPAGSYRYGGDSSNLTNSPGGTWWIYENKRHSNASNYWGTQVAWGWEDNANKLATRNITGGTFGSWVYYLNNSNYASYVSQLTSLGVGTAASGTTGEIRATSEITAYYSSDENLKENIVVIEDALGKLKQIRGVMFDWKESYIESRGGEDDFFVRKHDTGVIAQDVEKVLPELVAERYDGTKAVRYEKLAGIIIQAINELSDKVEELSKRIK